MVRVVSSLALLTVAGAATLRADFKDFSNRCSVGSVQACASLQVYTTLNGSGGTSVTILVRNLQGWAAGIGNSGGSILTRIGLVAPTNVGFASGLSITTSGAGATTVGTPGVRWSLAQPSMLGGLIELTAGLPPQGGSVDGGITGCDAPSGGFPTSYFQTCDGGWVAIAFTTANAWSADDAELAWLSERHVNGPDGIECVTFDDGDGGRDACPNAVVPEPVTMILLGSGLAGMGGMGVIRRRFGKDVKSA